MRRIPFFLLTAAVGTTALVLALVLPKPVQLQAYEDYSVPWAVLTLTALLVSVLYCVGLRIAEAKGTPQARALLMDALSAVLLVIAVCLIVPPQSIIESDENSVVATAQAIRYLHAPASVLSGHIDASGALVPDVLTMDKRGVMFPLMLNAIAPHAAGFHDAARWVNAAAGVAVLFLLTRMVRRFLRSNAAIAAAVLLTCFPVFAISVRGGTFDVVNVALLMLLCHLATGQLVRHSLARLLLFATGSAVICQLRYESVLVVALLTGALMLAALLRNPSNGRSAVLVMIPLLLIPAIWRFAIPFDYEMPGPWFEPWSLRNVPDNLERIVAWLLTPAGMPLGNPLISVLPVLALLVMLVTRQRLARREQTLPLLAFCLPAVTLTTVFVYSYWGQISNPLTARYFIFLAACFAGMGAIVIHRLIGSVLHRHNTTATLVLTCALLAIDIRRSVTTNAFDNIFVHRFRDSAIIAIEQAYGSCNVLVTSFRGALLATRGFGSLLPGRLSAFLSRQPDPLIANKIRAVALVAEISPDVPTSQAFLDRFNAHTPVAQHQLGDSGARVYQIWPSSKVDPNACGDHPRTVTDIRIDPAHPPLLTWEALAEEKPISLKQRMLLIPENSHH